MVQSVLAGALGMGSEELLTPDGCKQRAKLQDLSKAAPSVERPAVGDLVTYKNGEELDGASAMLSGRLGYPTPSAKKCLTFLQGPVLCCDASQGVVQKRIIEVPWQERMW